MKTEEEIGEFYGKFYDRLVKFACNANRGGDGTTIEEDDARDLISDLMLYHLESPDKFLPSHVYHSIMQRRLNLLRDINREVEILIELKGQPILVDVVEPDVDRKRISKLIREDIKEIDNNIAKAVVSRYIILGEDYTEAVSNVSGSNKMMIHRFLEETKEKYSSVYSEDD